MAAPVRSGRRDLVHVRGVPGDDSAPALRRIVDFPEFGQERAVQDHGMPASLVVEGDGDAGGVMGQ